ncbi:hypothetical protein DSO57_1034878 [Entomophthora muscae]|uniref:Uncharacterized protein n=1 Tax=Entomophthora muscae TaxID=34485 RepID=A0ACC2REH3_9FUNG|nr:hypothetical protein DSO57_1034878 [Entomophthora muscae]
MEGSFTALEVIQQCGHQASVYPASHADVYLADVIFFNIGSTLQEHYPQAFNNLYLGVFDHRKCWGKIGKFPIQEAKFDKEFPPLFGENKNQIEEKPDFSRRQINLSSGQAPASTVQMPATPASLLTPSQPLAGLPPIPCLLPGSQLAASHPPGSQGPPCNQSEVTVTCSQSEKSLVAEKN